MSNRLERILWSRKTVNLADFVKLHGNDLPKIVIVKQTSPVLGTVKREQILRLSKICTQTRLTCTDDTGQKWSIPTDYPIPVEVLVGGVYSPPQKINELGYPLPLSVRFVGDTKFHFSGETGEVNLGLVTMASISDDTFIMANSIDKGVVEGRVVAIPTTASILVGVAQGFGQDHVSQDDWLTFQKILNSVIEELNSDAVIGCKEIISVSVPKSNRPDRLLLCTPEDEQIVSYPQIKLDERLPPIPRPARPVRYIPPEPINEWREIKWSKKHYSLKDFYDTFSDNLPQIIKVVSGVYGVTEMETYGVDEIYRIKRHSRQKRVIAMDTGKQYMSIPVNYPAKLQVMFGPDDVSEPLSLERIVENFDLPIKVRFINGDFLNHSDQSTYTMKELDLQDTYNETYFLINTLNQGTISQTVLIMPVYVDIDVVVAESWKKKSHEEWLKYLKRLEDETANVNYNFKNINKNIAMYSPGQVNVGDNIYEYIVPKNFVSIFDDSVPLEKAPEPVQKPPKSKTEKRGKKIQEYCTTNPRKRSEKNPYSPLDIGSSTRRPGYEVVTTNVGQPAYVSPKDTSSPGAYSAPSPLTSPTSPKSPTQRGGVRALPLPDVPKPSNPHSEPKGLTLPTSPKSPTQRGGVRVLPLPDVPKPNPGPKVLPKSTTRDLTAPDNSGSYARNRGERPEYGNSRRSGTWSPKAPSGSQSKDIPGGKSSGSTTAGEPEHLLIRHVQDIPKDTSCLTVEELCDCLTLLNLGKYTRSFRSMNIDGILLMDFTAEDFQKDPNFQMTVTEAKMLMRFAKDGWRPKHS